LSPGAGRRGDALGVVTVADTDTTDTRLTATIDRALVAEVATAGEPTAEMAGLGEREVNFAHESERKFAAILDFYQIHWEYEPRTFPLRWAPDGRVIESFTPDFYLVDHELYIELTTLKQSLVTKKNRKLRLFRGLYPNIPIKLLYARDFRSLMAKYGLQDTS